MEFFGVGDKYQRALIGESNFLCLRKMMGRKVVLIIPLHDFHCPPEKLMLDFCLLDRYIRGMDIQRGLAYRLFPGPEFILQRCCRR